MLFQDIRSGHPRDGQIGFLQGCLGDIGMGHLLDVLGTNVCWLGCENGIVSKTYVIWLESLISRVLIDSYFSHDELVSVDVLREYYDMKEAIKYLITSTVD